MHAYKDFDRFIHRNNDKDIEKYLRIKAYVVSQKAGPLEFILSVL